MYYKQSKGPLKGAPRTKQQWPQESQPKRTTKSPLENPKHKGDPVTRAQSIITKLASCKAQESSHGNHKLVSYVSQLPSHAKSKLTNHAPLSC